MPSSTYLPSTEAELISFSTNFDTKITANPTRYGLDAAQATAYTALHDAFVAAWNLLQDPDTKTKPNTVSKNNAKDALIDGTGGIRQLVALVQATPSVTDVQRAELRITIKDTEPTPVPVPSESPILSIISTVGRVVKVRLQDRSDPDSRAKPTGTVGASVLSYVGDEPPSDLSEWKIEGLFTRTTGDVTFPSTVAAGATVWITSYWLNTRGESGPASPSQTTNVQGGSAQAA